MKKLPNYTFAEEFVQHSFHNRSYLSNMFSGLRRLFGESMLLVTSQFLELSIIPVPASRYPPAWWDSEQVLFDGIDLEFA